MIDFVSRHRESLWLGLIAGAMVMTWVSGFDSQRGTWAVIVSGMLFNIWGRLGELLDAIERSEND